MPRTIPSDPSRALVFLVERYSDRLMALARRLCPSAADAEDAVQETFLQAFRKWGTFRGGSDPGTWLYTICVRICRRRGQRASRRRTASLDAAMPASGPIVDPESLERDHALTAQVRREAVEAVEGAIAELPFVFRVPLVLKDILELPVADVARALDIKPATVKTRVHRARLMLRGSLDRTLPTRSVPSPIYQRQVCMDLLAAKQASLDRGETFPVGPDVMCQRCRAVFAGMNLAMSACSQLAQGGMPPALKQAVEAHLRAHLSETRKPPGNRRRIARSGTLGNRAASR